MSSYPAPTLHNGLLNTVFNPKDFTTTSKLNSTVVNGPLNINGLASCNAGLKVNGSINTTVSTNTVNASVSGQLTLPSTTVINSSNDVVDTTNNQTISGTKTFSSTITGSVSGNAGTVTDGVYLSTAQTITGAKTFSNNITLTSTSAPTTTGTQLGSVVSASNMSTSSAFTLGTMKQLGSITFANPGVYLITGNMNFQCVTTAGTITFNMYLSTVAAGSGTTGSNSNCQIQPPLISTVVNSYYGYQISGIFTITSASTPIYFNALISGTGAYNTGSSGMTMVAVRIA
jgi:hypothetical protein